MWHTGRSGGHGGPLKSIPFSAAFWEQEKFKTSPPLLHAILDSLLLSVCGCYLLHYYVFNAYYMVVLERTDKRQKCRYHSCFSLITTEITYVSIYDRLQKQRLTEALLWVSWSFPVEREVEGRIGGVRYQLLVDLIQGILPAKTSISSEQGSGRWRSCLGWVALQSIRSLIISDLQVKT